MELVDELDQVCVLMQVRGDALQLIILCQHIVHFFPDLACQIWDAAVLIVLVVGVVLVLLLVVTIGAAFLGQHSRRAWPSFWILRAQGAPGGGSG